MIKYTMLGAIGGFTYYLIENLWRGYSHWTMFTLGGICFICLGLINELLEWETPLWKQTLIGTIVITSLEFITGVIVNIWLDWNVWNYSNMPFNILGQVCPQFALLWMPIAVFGIILDDYIRYWFFKEEKPRYKLM